MTGTGKASFIGFESTAEMSAGQAQGGESTIGVDEKRRYLWNGSARAKRILIHGAEVKFRFAGGFRFVGKKSKQAASGKRAAQVKKTIAGKFQKITAGNLVHYYFSIA